MTSNRDPQTQRETECHSTREEKPVSFPASYRRRRFISLLSIKTHVSKNCATVVLTS